SLLSSLSKILERIILNRINTHINNNNILPDEQCGFRRNRSTAHQLIRVLQTAKEKLNEKKSTGIIFLDVEKAFDRVWHNGLLYKMIKLNFPPAIVKTVSSFLNERLFSVHIGGKFSNEHRIEHGVPQGAVLSPTLYNIYTHDITRGIPSEIALFADDTALYHSSKRIRDIKKTLRKAGDKIQGYMQKWKISLNKQKTQAIFITRRRSRELPGTAINIFNERITWEDQSKYLGMIIDKRVTFKKHIEYVTQRANTALRLLYPLINRNSLLDVRNKLLIYKLAIRPVFTYGCPAFQGIAKTHIRQLQILQNKFLRIILNKTRFERIADLHEEAKIPRIDEYITKLQENFNHRLLN
ncbi:MAG: RNA-directed DNA polymerase, partial [Fusobacteriaceae bacterium]